MFTDAEKLATVGLATAGISARAALISLESTIPLTLEPTRAELGRALHPLLEAVEGASNALSFLAGAIAVRGEEEKPAARLWKREEFVARAFIEVSTAMKEALEGDDLLGKLFTNALPPISKGIAVARTHLSRAYSRLSAFSRSRLLFADPLAWAGVDPLLQRDFQTNIYRASNQYLYDALAKVLEAYTADPPILTPALLDKMRSVLAWGWLIQDDFAKHACRGLGIQWVSGEDPLPTAFWDTISDIEPRFQFMCTYMALLLTEEAVLARPELQKCLIFAIAKGTDAWKRGNYFLGLIPVLMKWMPPRAPFGTHELKSNENFFVVGSERMLGIDSSDLL